MSSTINGKEFTCPMCGGHEIHEIITGCCRSVFEAKSLSGYDGSWDDWNRGEVLDVWYDGHEENTYVCADCGREVDCPDDDL
jgi:DNA-directed RNA polymerase subunit RPC12/RpoP